MIVVMVRGPPRVHVDMVMIARDNNVAVVVMVTVRGSLLVYIDVVVVTRYHYVVVRAVMVVVMGFRTWNTTVKMHMLVISLDLYRTLTIVVVTDMDVIVGARHYDIAMGTACLQR